MNWRRRDPSLRKPPLWTEERSILFMRISRRAQDLTPIPRKFVSASRFRWSLHLLTSLGILVCSGHLGTRSESTPITRLCLRLSTGGHHANGKYFSFSRIIFRIKCFNKVRVLMVVFFASRLPATGGNILKKLQTKNVNLETVS